MSDLDNIDIKKMLEYIEKTTKESAKSFVYDVVCDSSKTTTDYNKNEITCVIDVTPKMVEGYSVGELRACGCEIDSEIPDCAVMRDGKLEWITINFTIMPDGTVKFDKNI